jgi:hypothetical protein
VVIDVAPITALYLPAEHIPHVWEPVVYVPAGHDVAQELEPSAENRFVSHGMHVSIVLAPIVVEYVPAAQTVHVDVAVGEYVPESHGVHVDDPATAYVPASHCMHGEVAPIAVEYVPVAHGMHVEDPGASAYVPGPHCMHVFTLVAPIAVEYFPVTQGVQVDVATVA